MKNDGWVKIHRKLRDNPIYTKPVGLMIWLECLLATTHETIKIDYAGEERDLNPGEFVFGRIAWSKRLKVSQTTVYKWIQKLIERGMIREQVGEQGKPTIFKVEKWEEYQVGEQVGEQVSRQVSRQVRNRLVDTNKNVKNVKKRDSTRTPPPSKPLFNEEYATKLAEELLVPLPEIRRVWEMMVASRISQGKPYKEWNMALRNWVLRRIDEGKLQPSTGKIIYKSQL